MFTSKFLVAAAPATLLFSLAAGCSDDKVDSKGEEFATPEGLQSALENPIVDCQQQALDCAQNASDIDARIACNDALAGCLSGAAERSRTIAVRVEACRDDARVCVQDGTELSTCRDNYDACADAALNSGAEDAGVTDASAPVASLDGGAPTLPSFPGLGGGLLGGGGFGGGGIGGGGIGGGGIGGGGLGGGLPSLPAVGVDGGLGNLPAPLKCTIELQLCVATDPSAAGQCGDTARACLQAP